MEDTATGQIGLKKEREERNVEVECVNLRWFAMLNILLMAQNLADWGWYDERSRIDWYDWPRGGCALPQQTDDYVVTWLVAKRLRAQVGREKYSN